MADGRNLYDIERTIIGSMFADPRCVGEVVAKLSPEDFSSTAMRGLYIAISKLHLAGAPIDPVSVIHEAGDDYVEAYRAVREFGTRSVLYFCDLLLEQSKLLRAQHLAEDLACAESMADADKALDQLNALMVTRKSVEIVSSGDAAREFLTRQDGDKPEYMPWGIRELDDALNVDPGDFVVIGGYPSSGKTLLSLQFAVAQAEKYRVGYFSLETNVRKLSDRLMAHMAQISHSRIKRHELDQKEWTVIPEAVDRIGRLHLDFVGAGGMTIRDIQAVALNRRYQVIYVDYLQLVAADGKNRYEQVTNISQGLHTLAQAHGITVVASAQLSRPEKTSGKPQPPNMSSFRESGQIEQDADVAMLLYAEDPNNNYSDRILKIGKNKDGEKLKLTMSFCGATQTMTPVKPSLQEGLRKVNAEKRQAEQQKMEFTALPAGAGTDMPF